MAKSLEEHLYRSAQTKEEYLDPETLKKRLQLIAHGLELHRSTSGPLQGNGSNAQQQATSELQQLLMGGTSNQNQQNKSQQQALNDMSQRSSMSQNSVPGMIGGGNNNNNNSNSNSNDPFVSSLSNSAIGGIGMNTGNIQGGGQNGNPLDAASAEQQRKVIKQQQQRLLLLRHASKCREGANCTNKYCAQMTTLWRHMKKCRDKNCTTSHCLSSRCVLNHYRICKSNGRTSTCEVCGPVMEQIKRTDGGGNASMDDPLGVRPDPSLPDQLGMSSSNNSVVGSLNNNNSNAGNANANANNNTNNNNSNNNNNDNNGGSGSNSNNAMNNINAMGNLMQQMNNANNNGNSSGGGGGGNNSNNQNSMQALQQMQQMLQQQQQQQMQQPQQALQQFNSLQQQQQQQNNSIGNDIANSVGSMMQQATGSNGEPVDVAKYEQLQLAQQKLTQQHQVLQQLQKQQAQLLEQQAQLQKQRQHLQDPEAIQGQQLQRQHVLLQQLQQRCQEQQDLIQQELRTHMHALKQGQIPSQIQNSVISSMQQGNLNQNAGAQNNSNNSQSMLDASQRSQGSHHSNSLSQQQSSGPNDLSTDLSQHASSQQKLNQQSQQSSQHSDSGLNIVGGIDPLDPDHQDDPLLGIGTDNSNSGNKNGGMNGVGAVDNDNNNNSNDNNDNNQSQSQNQSSQQQQSHQHDLSNDNDIITGNSDKIPDDQHHTNDNHSQQPNPSIPKMINTAPDPDSMKKDERSTQRRGSMGGRGRGEKGKRLRELSDLPGGSLSLDAFKPSERKRGADQLSGSSDEPANKSAKRDGSFDGDGDGPMMPTLSRADMDNHLSSLNKGLHLTSRSITSKCLPIIDGLIENPFGWVFRDAVDPVVFGLPDYFEVVKNPMHLLLVKKKLQNAVYTDMASFERDVKLVFENAIMYNGEDSEVGQLALQMMSNFTDEFQKVLAGV